MKKDPNEMLEAIIAGNKAKAEKKKAQKPGRVDAMKARKQGQKDPETGLNDQQELFCQEYLTDFNATQAAIRAGYSQKTAYSMASALLKKHEVQARLNVLRAPRAKKLEVTADRVMEEVAKIAFASLGDFIKVQPDGTGYIDLKDVTPEMFAALESYEVTELPPFKTVENGEEVVREVLKIKVKLSSKLDALEKLMRRHNLIKPMEVNHNHSGKVAFELPDLARRTAFLLAKAAKLNDTKPQGVNNAGATGEASVVPG